MDDACKNGQRSFYQKTMEHQAKIKLIKKECDEQERGLQSELEAKTKKVIQLREKLNDL